MEFILETLWIALFFVVMCVYVTGKRWWAWGLFEEKPFKYAAGVVMTVISVLLIMRLYVLPFIPSTN